MNLIIAAICLIVTMYIYYAERLTYFNLYHKHSEVGTDIILNLYVGVYKYLFITRGMLREVKKYTQGHTVN